METSIIYISTCNVILISFIALNCIIFIIYYYFFFVFSLPSFNMCDPFIINISIGFFILFGNAYVLKLHKIKKKITIGKHHLPHKSSLYYVTNTHYPHK